MASVLSHWSASLSIDSIVTAVRNDVQVVRLDGRVSHIDNGRFLLTWGMRWPFMLSKASISTLISSAHTMCVYTLSLSLSVITPMSSTSSVV